MSPLKPGVITHESGVEVEVPVWDLDQEDCGVEVPKRWLGPDRETGTRSGGRRWGDVELVWLLKKKIEFLAGPFTRVAKVRKGLGIIASARERMFRYRRVFRQTVFCRV